jgi:hypothetical protein
MLAVAGAIGALLFAYLLLGYMTRVASSAAGQVPLEYACHLDLWSVLFTLGMTLLGGAGFGLAPAFACTRTSLAETFKTAAAELPRYRRFGLRNLLVGSQVAAPLTILLLTAYFALGFETTARIDPGFDTSRHEVCRPDGPHRAAIGLAGVTAYAVVRRKKEIGIRMALGAHARQVLQLVLREGAVLVAVGSILGLFGAWGASRALAGTLDELARAFDLSAGNLTLLIGAPLLLAGIALAACYIPARRSARIDPLIALREE